MKPSALGFRRPPLKLEGSAPSFPIAEAAASIAYSDGDAVEARILDLLRAAPDLGSHVRIAEGEYDSWPVRYHLCPERSLLLRPFRFSGLRVLELGAGMGGVSRFLAEEAAHLTAVEGTQARASALRERLRDLGNWDASVCNIQSFETSLKYDVVCLIGVLEYAELSISGAAPHRALLSKAASFLAEGGVLIVAIENRLGLKYWNGASEDHTGRLFDGVSGYSERPTPRTFSRRELKELVHQAGCAHVREFFPFPDYKVPHAVLSAEFIERDAPTCAEIATVAPFEDYARPRAALMPDVLAAASVASGGLLADLANSFLFLATNDPASPAMARLCAPAMAGEIGWHFSCAGRAVPTGTTFSRPEPEGNAIQVRKASLFTELPQGARLQSGTMAVRWKPLDKAPLLRGPKLTYRLAQAAYREDWARFSDLLEGFLRWSFEQWSGLSPAMLQADAVDAIASNAMTSETGGFRLFDLEWSLEGEMPGTWFILRNVMALRTLCLADDAQCPFASLGSLYHFLCSRLGLVPALRADIRLEVSFQAAAGGRHACWADVRHVVMALHSAFPRAAAPRDSAQLVDRRAQLDQREAQIAKLEEDVTRLRLMTESGDYRRGVEIGRIFARFPLLRTLVRLAYRLTRFRFTRWR